MPFADLNVFNPGKAFSSPLEEKKGLCQRKQGNGKESPFGDLLKKIAQEKVPKDETNKKRRLGQAGSFGGEQGLWQMGAPPTTNRQTPLQASLTKANSSPKEGKPRAVTKGLTPKIAFDHREPFLTNQIKGTKKVKGEGQGGTTCKEKFKVAEKPVGEGKPFEMTEGATKLKKSNQPNPAKVFGQQKGEGVPKEIWQVNKGPLQEAPPAIQIKNPGQVPPNLIDGSAKEKFKGPFQKLSLPLASPNQEAPPSPSKLFFENLLEKKEVEFSQTGKDGEPLVGPARLGQPHRQEKSKVPPQNKQDQETLTFTGIGKEEPVKGNGGGPSEEPSGASDLKEGKAKMGTSLEGTAKGSKAEDSTDVSRRKTTSFKEFLTRENQGELTFTKEVQGETKTASPKAVATTPYPAQVQEEIVEQVVAQAQITSFGQKEEMEIRLKPEYLGGLKLRVSLEDGQMKATFLVENPLVKEVLEANLDTLKSFLQNGTTPNQGIELDIRGESNKEQRQGQTDFTPRSSVETTGLSQKDPEPLKKDLLRQLDYRI